MQGTVDVEICWAPFQAVFFRREGHFDCNDGVEEEVDKQTSISVANIVHSNKVTAKGAKANVAKKLSFDNYEYCLNYLLPKRVDIKRIGSDLHRVSTYSKEKIG